MIQQKKIGLALGSGSARGWAHIGVIRALTEAGIRVDYVAGTSIGALVGAFFAAGKIDVLEDVVLQLDWKQLAYLFLDLRYPKSGLVDGKKIADLVRDLMKEENIEDLPVAFCAVCTDITTGHEVSLRDGDLIQAIRASISIPGTFTPVKKGKNILVDGGLVNPLPVSVVRDMGADFVIAVDLNHDTVRKRSTRNFGVSHSEKSAFRRHKSRKKILEKLNRKIATLDISVLSRLNRWMNSDPLPNVFEILGTSINIMEVQITATRLKTEPPDLLIRPNLGDIRFLEFYRAKEAIAEGYREATSQISSLKTCTLYV